MGLSSLAALARAVSTASRSERGVKVMIKRTTNVLKQIFWPPASPPAFSIEGYDDHYWLVILCCLLVIPFAAVLHHSVFYYPTCMLNPFGDGDYNSLSFYNWISRDPSLPW